MSKKWFWLALAAGVVLIITLAARLHAGHQAWRTYQQAYFLANGQPRARLVPRAITPGNSGQPEYCLTCHLGLEEISSSHPVEVFGCVACHGGDGLALDEARAHAGLRGGKNPSDLQTVRAGCGQGGCHAGYDQAEHNHIDSVERSLQATYASGIALLRYAFGAQPDAEPHYGVRTVSDGRRALRELPVSQPQDLTPALAARGVAVSGHPIDSQFRAGCLEGGCHLWTEPAPAPYRYRSTGCAACHVLYDDDGLYKGADPTIPKDEPGHARAHRLTTAIPFSQCNHCHNRGNYSLRSMTFTPRADLPPLGPAISPIMPAEGKRLKEYYQPIGRFTRCEWELDCIDCHTRNEAMGDGRIAGAVVEAQRVRCQTCHGDTEGGPSGVELTTEDAQALRQARLNPHIQRRVGDRVLLAPTGEKMYGVRQRADGQWELTMKVSGKKLLIPLVYGSACEQDPQEQHSSACHDCHAYQR